nr:hypothetical protein [uncultured Dyadobacter sp.]
MKHLFLILFTAIAGFLSCVDADGVQSRCLQGKYLGMYCEGAVIQLFNDEGPGKTWKNQFGTTMFTNCVVANLDTTVFKGITDPFNMKGDSVFYFQFRDGGYARKEFKVCEPSSFITITKTSLGPCSDKIAK